MVGVGHHAIVEAAVQNPELEFFIFFKGMYLLFFSKHFKYLIKNGKGQLIGINLYYLQFTTVNMKIIKKTSLPRFPLDVNSEGEPSTSVTQYNKNNMVIQYMVKKIMLKKCYKYDRLI